MRKPDYFRCVLWGHCRTASSLCVENSRSSTRRAARPANATLLAARGVVAVVCLEQESVVAVLCDAGSLL